MAVLISFLVAVISPFAVIRPAYEPPRILAVDEISGLNRTDVSFGEKARLLGYDLEERTIVPGEAFRVTLWWKCLAPMERDYSVFLHLVSEEDIIIAQRDVYPGQGTYPTSFWQPGDVIKDTYVLSIPPAVVTPARMELVVGLYSVETGERLQATREGGEDLGDKVSLVQLTLPVRERDGVPNPMRRNLGNRIALVGYTLDRTAAVPGEAFHLTLYWQALRDVQKNYSVFTQVLGPDERRWAQMDGWPQQGDSPTATWRRGQIVRDEYELVVSEDAPPTVCGLWVGMYDADGRRLNVLSDDGHVEGDRISLGSVRILPKDK